MLSYKYVHAVFCGEMKGFSSKTISDYKHSVDLTIMYLFR